MRIVPGLPRGHIRRTYPAAIHAATTPTTTTTVPISLKLDVQTNQIRMIITGTPGPAESRVAVNLAKGFGGTQDRALLIDATGLEHLPNADELRQAILPVAQEFAAAGIFPMALLTHSDAQYGTGRMFQAISEENGLLFSVFREESQAVRWLEHQRGS